MLSLERMRAIEIDVATRVAVVEPGAFNSEVKAAAAEHGLWYPPDPSSFEICSIGGNIATNAGGLCCVKYGVTTDYVLGLDVVLADGTLVTLGGKRIKDVAGLSLVKLFVGSEGTLGIVTRAILRLIPAQGIRSTLVATFPTVAAAADAVVDIGRTLRASMMELMDAASINAVEDYRPMGLDRSAGAMLIAQSDAPGAACAAEIELMSASCVAAGAKEVFVTDDAGGGRDVRRRAPGHLPGHRGPRARSCSRTSGPRSPSCRRCWRRSPGSPRRTRWRSRRSPTPGTATPTRSWSTTRPTRRAEQRASEAFDAIMAAAIALGGTITGEHGVGRTKKRALPDQLGPEAMALTRTIKPPSTRRASSTPAPSLAAPVRRGVATAGRGGSGRPARRSRRPGGPGGWTLGGGDPLQGGPPGRARERVPVLPGRGYGVQGLGQLGRLDQVLHVVQRGPGAGGLRRLDHRAAGRRHPAGCLELGDADLVRPGPRAGRPPRGEQQLRAELVQAPGLAVDPADSRAPPGRVSS